MTERTDRMDQHQPVASGRWRRGRPKGLAMAILASQLLLLALAFAWGVHQVLLAKYGAIYSGESSSVVVYAQIIAVAAIALFAVGVFVVSLSYFRRSGNENVSSHNQEQPHLTP